MSRSERRPARIRVSNEPPCPLFIKCGQGGLAAALRERRALVFYGDTRSDREAAQTADVPFIFRENGFHARETVFAI